MLGKVLELEGVITLTPPTSTESASADKYTGVHIVLLGRVMTIGRLTVFTYSCKTHAQQNRRNYQRRTEVLIHSTQETQVRENRNCRNAKYGAGTDLATF